MKKAQSSPKGTIDPVCGVSVKPDSSKPMASHMGQPLKLDPPRKKGWWARYVERLKKHEGDVRSCCH